MITGIEHVAILSSDTARLKDWYIKMLDFRQVFENESKTYFLKSGNGALIEFVTAEGDGGRHGLKAGGLRHIALSVDKFDETVSFLKKNNAEVVSEPETTPTGVKTFFFRDPDGNILHLVQRPKPF
jgi:glyoxylase I family protein